MNKSLVHAPATDAPIALGMTFDEQPEFHGTVGRAVLGGGLGAFVAHGIGSVVGLADGFSLLVTLIVTGALVAVSAREKSASRTLLGAIFGLAGGLLHSVYGGEWPMLGALLIGGAAAPILAKGEPPAKMAVTGLFTGVMAYAGLYVASVLQAQGVFSGLLPGALASAAAGSATGLFLGLGAAPKHVVAAEDPVEASYLSALLAIEGELADILDRALSIYRAVRDDLEGRELAPSQAQLGLQVGEMSMRILGIAEKCATVEDNLEAASANDVGERIAALRSKAASTPDATAKATLESAIASLEDQSVVLESIGRGRERVVARLHANVALLEKVRFSLVHLKSADIERAGNEETPLDAALGELHRELDATSAAVSEVYGDGQARLTSGSLDQAIEDASQSAALRIATPESDTDLDLASDTDLDLPPTTEQLTTSDDLSDALPDDEDHA